MAYSLDSSKDSCYLGTTVLINKLGLQEQADLDAAERVAVAVHAVEIETAPPSGPFTFAYYLDLHRRLFQDLYDWAGTLRTINLSKKGHCFLSRFRTCGIRRSQISAIAKSARISWTDTFSICRCYR